MSSRTNLILGDYLKNILKLITIGFPSFSNAAVLVEVFSIVFKSTFGSVLLCANEVIVSSALTNSNVTCFIVVF